MWEVIVTDEFNAWYNGLDKEQTKAVFAVVGMLEDKGPNLGRPHADKLAGSDIHNLKELRPRSKAKNCRIIFVFDPKRRAVLLVAGDKTGQWGEWYSTAIPQAEKLYEKYLKEA